MTYMLEDVDELLHFLIIASRQQLLGHALYVEGCLLALVVHLVVESPDNVCGQHLRRIGRILAILYFMYSRG